MSELIFGLILEFYWKVRRRKFGSKDDKFSESKHLLLMGVERSSIGELPWIK